MSRETEIGRRRDALSEKEQEISQAQQQGMELKGEMDRHEHRIQFNEDRMRDWQAQNARASSDIAQAEERRLVARGGIGAGEPTAGRFDGGGAVASAGHAGQGARRCRRWKTSCAPPRRPCARPRPSPFPPRSN